MTRRGTGVLLVTAALFALATPVPSAHAATRCADTRAGGGTWAVAQANTNCAFARHAVRLAVDRRRSPTNWRCFIKTEAQEFDPERRIVRVRCVRGAKRVVGVAR